MGASFAKSIFKIRGAKARKASPELEWALGWVCHARLKPVSQAERGQNDAGNSTTATDTTSYPTSHPPHDEANPEERS